MGDISAANATLMFTVPGLFPVPVQVQGFGPDDVYSLDDIELVETQMGVDGVLSGGFVWKASFGGIGNWTTLRTANGVPLASAAAVGRFDGNASADVLLWHSNYLDIAGSVAPKSERTQQPRRTEW